MSKSIKRYKSWTLLALIFLLLMASYFLFNPSYEKSLEAKFHYAMGNYHKAYVLSSEAFAEEPYNRMANSIMVQSKYALRYVNYNLEAEQYLSIIKDYASKDKISIENQMRIKMMCDIMIDKHQKMQATILIDKELVKKSLMYYEQFADLHEQLIKKI